MFGHFLTILIEFWWEQNPRVTVSNPECMLSVSDTKFQQLSSRLCATKSSNRSFSNRASDKRFRCFVRISEAVLKSLSTGAPDGITVLYFNCLTCGWFCSIWISVDESFRYARCCCRWLACYGSHTKRSHHHPGWIQRVLLMHSSHSLPDQVSACKLYVKPEEDMRAWTLDV